MKYEGEISLAKFLTRYAWLCGEDLKKLTHDDVKALFPYIKRSSFEDLENELANEKGNIDRKILLVNDGHRTIPYYIPDFYDCTEDFTDFNYGEVEEEEEVIQNYDYVSMSNYELKCVLDSKFNTRRSKLNARHELEDRGVVMKKQKDKKSKYKENYYGEY